MMPKGSGQNAYAKTVPKNGVKKSPDYWHTHTTPPSRQSLAPECSDFFYPKLSLDNIISQT